MTIENKEMGIRFEVDNQQDFDKWYAIRKEQIRADAIEEFRIKLFEKLVRLTLSMWYFKLFDDALQETYKELMEQNEQNTIIEALKPRECADMPKEIICNCTKELTYREIFEHFLEKCETKSPIEDYRPCIQMFGVPDIPYAIVIWLADGTKIIYIDK